MRKILLAGLAGMFMAGPALADPRDYRYDRHEFRQDRRDFREDRRDYRQDRRDDRRWDGPRYRGSAYAHPRGFAYRPYGLGYRLPPAYFGRGYWIGNPGYFRLPPAGWGARWVRVGPDALLIRVSNGLILRAVRGIYW